MRRTRFPQLLALAPLVAATAPMPAAAQIPVQAARPPALERPTGSFDFSIPNMMRGPEVYGREPQRVQWTADGRWIYFLWQPPGTEWNEPLRPHRVRAAAGGRPERVTDAQMDSVGPLLQSGDLSADRRSSVVAHDGDIYLVDRRAGTARRLTDTPGEERAPQFSADGRTVYFVRDGMNVMALDLGQPLVRQLTDVRVGP